MGNLAVMACAAEQAVQYGLEIPFLAMVSLCLKQIRRAFIFNDMVREAGTLIPLGSLIALQKGMP
jgi:hypothetical protein